MTDQLPQKSLTTPIPANETERLAALHRYQILDTPPDVAFDRITTLAARLFNMPIALISLVDESRAWFKSCIGFTAREVPRDATLCSFAVLTNEPLIILDTRLDERFACNPFVQSEPGVRFYAGAPLLSRDGFNLGTLCLLDTQPRNSFSAEQQATLVDLAAMVVDELELRLAAQKIAQVDAALLEITQGVATVTGEAFFAALVQHFAKVLDADYAYIGLVEGDDATKMLRTIATGAGGQIVDNFEYPLQDTPCWEVIEQRKICCYPRNVQAQFPNTPLLKPLAVESYVAIPFFDSRGIPLGLLGVMDGKPLENVQLAESLLTIFAQRIATELERQLFEQERERFLAVGSDLQVITKADGYFQWVSPSFERLLGWTVEEMTSRPWTDFVHPDDINSSVLEADGLFCGNKTLAFENRYRHKDGSYRWLLWKAQLYSEEQVLYGAAVDITERKQAEQALRQSEARLRLAIEVAHLGTWRYDLGTNLVELDGRMREIWGEKENTALLPLSQVLERIHPDDRAQVTSAIGAALDPMSSGAYEIDYRIVWRDGTERWISANGQAAFAGEGALRQALEFLGTAVDITERKQAEATIMQREAQFRQLADAMPQQVWITDAQGNTQYVNQQWTTYTGLTLEQTQNIHYVAQVIHPDDFEITRELLTAALATGTPYQAEFRLKHQVDRTYRWFLSRAIAIRNEQGQIVQWFGTSTDIEEFRRIQVEREQLLAQEQTARETAERANRVKDEFLAVLSHELRSPLNPILGWARLLQNSKLDQSRQTEALKTIERNAKLQSQLIEDLLDISRIMQGKLSLTVAPVSLMFVISAALETVRLAVEAKNITLALDIGPENAPVSGDAARLQQVVWNLLTNAVKFTPNSGQVTIELRHLDGLAQLRVIDTGKGINPHFLPYVFEYFQQEDGSTTRKFGGLGLGLAIVQQIVEMHGGTVKAESRGENQGATFIVQLPLMPQAAPIALKPIIAQTDLKAPLDNIQILLVDDEPDTREFQAFLLEQSGAKVTAVASGLEALQVMDQLIPDVLVSDVGMADMDGYMLIGLLRARPPSRGGAIPAIALTAYAAEVDCLRAIRAGFQTFLTKPVEAETLVKALVTLLNGNQP